MCFGHSYKGCYYMFRICLFLIFKIYIHIYIILEADSIKLRILGTLTKILYNIYNSSINV